MGMLCFFKAWCDFSRAVGSQEQIVATTQANIANADMELECFHANMRNICLYNSNGIIRTQRKLLHDTATPYVEAVILCAALGFLGFHGSVFPRQTLQEPPLSPTSFGAL